MKIHLYARQNNSCGQKVYSSKILVRIEFLNEDGTICVTNLCEEFNGWYVAEDTGGRIKGKQIDIYAGPELGLHNIFHLPLRIVVTHLYIFQLVITL